MKGIINKYRAETPKGRCAKIERTCPACGIRFIKRADAGPGCSAKCTNQLRSTAIPRICQTCGKQFRTIPSQFKHYKGAGKYCSRSCSYAGIVASNVDKPITDKYGRSGRKADHVWQQAVRERDNFTCQKCGKHDPAIHAHHVAPRNHRPDLRHDVSNGKCLCGSCHQWVHHNPVEATELGLLADVTYGRPYTIRKIKAAA